MSKEGRKFKKVMREFAKDKLRSSDGSKVASHAQALAIAYSEQRRSNAQRQKEGRKKKG